MLLATLEVCQALDPCCEWATLARSFCRMSVSVCVLLTSSHVMDERHCVVCAHRAYLAVLERHLLRPFCVYRRDGPVVEGSDMILTALNLGVALRSRSRTVSSIWRTLQLRARMPWGRMTRYRLRFLLGQLVDKESMRWKWKGVGGAERA